MIQRIQTLYLLIVTILMGLTASFPLADFLGADQAYKLYVWGVRTVGDSPEFVVKTIYMAVLMVIVTLLPLIAIFLFKKRWIQIRICIVEMVLLLGMQVYIGMYLYKSWVVAASETVHSISFSVIDVFPLVSIFFIFLAFKGIARDEALLKSLDRIR